MAEGAQCPCVQRGACVMCVCVIPCVCRSRVYMADLESVLHYSLRVEVAAHPVIKADALASLKKYVAVLAKVRERVSPSFSYGS